jgi:hypothetical protein
MRNGVAQREERKTIKVAVQRHTCMGFHHVFDQIIEIRNCMFASGLTPEASISRRLERDGQHWQERRTEP